MAAGYTHLRKALLEIADFSSKEWQLRGGDPLGGAYVFWDPELLEKKLLEDADQIEIPTPGMTYRLFLLPPAGDSVICLLAVNWEFVAEGDGTQEPKERENAGCVPRVFRVFLIPAEATGPVTPTVVRFDEQEDNEAWCFAHAQLCDTMTPYNEHFAPMEPGSWVSATLPRIPLAATQGPAPILVCVLAALYGVDSRLLKKVLQVLHDKDSRKVAAQLGWTG